MWWNGFFRQDVCIFQGWVSFYFSGSTFHHWFHSRISSFRDANEEVSVRYFQWLQSLWLNMDGVEFHSKISSLPVAYISISPAEVTHKLLPRRHLRNTFHFRCDGLEEFGSAGLAFWEAVGHEYDILWEMSSLQKGSFLNVVEFGGGAKCGRPWGRGPHRHPYIRGWGPAKTSVIKLILCRGIMLVVSRDVQVS